MQPRRVVLPLLLFLAAAVALAAARTDMARAEPPLWHDDYKAALAAAREQDKPVFLVFRCVP
ncbi:MAG: hypothetical protein HS108_12490 [Planctomycetes bacterium]|jgi:hypothetical protein|nr:hypothetical protein [Planctomycetota bacterium]MCL4730932.1 hypothetical protein [Planctomycetota bacterium]